MYTTTGRLKKKLYCAFEAQRWPFLTVLVLGSYPAGLRYLRSARTEKKLARERLSPFRKSASNITHSAIAEQKRSACVLYTVQHALSAYSLVRQPVQCSVLCMPRRCTTQHHLQSTNANRVLVPQYTNVSAVVKLLVVGKRCHTSCTTCTMGLYL